KQKWKRQGRRRPRFNSFKKIQPVLKHKSHSPRWFRFGHTRYLATYRRKARKKAHKFIFSTYKFNLLFKKILWNILQIPRAGELVVRFRQPARLLLGMKKFRKLARRASALARYRRHRSYRRLLPFLFILVRY